MREGGEGNLTRRAAGKGKKEAKMEETMKRNELTPRWERANLAETKRKTKKVNEGRPYHEGGNALIGDD